MNLQRVFYLPRVLPGTNKKMPSRRPWRLCGENPILDKSGVLYNIVQIPGTVNNTMNLNRSTTNHVKYEVGFNDEDSITRILEFFVTWYMTKKRMYFQIADTLVDFFNKRCGVSWTVTCNPVEDWQKVVNGNRKVTKSVPTCHISAAEAFSSLAYE